ncbi:MAG: zinc ribbon domain-containing protein [Planctomycetes bacterium]|nr:zinc ribbon domain-containing protein [Planctomycetota bacterium]
MTSSPDNQLRRCAACGQPIYSRARVHPECGEKELDKQPSNAPLKICSDCGEKSHVRTLVCRNCGAMF